VGVLTLHRDATAAAAESANALINIADSKMQGTTVDVSKPTKQHADIVVVVRY